MGLLPCMPMLHYCWRCGVEVPMLDEGEWAELHPLLSSMVGRIKTYRETIGAALEDAKKFGGRRGRWTSILS